MAPKEISEYKKQEQVKNQMDDLYEDCYRFAVPSHYVFMYDSWQKGQKNTGEIFDSTPVQSVQRFANRIHSTMAPPGTVPVHMSAGREIPPEAHHQFNLLLDVYAEIFFGLLDETNFHMELNRSLHDLIVGTCGLLIQDYDIDMPFTTTSIAGHKLVLKEGVTGMPFKIWNRHRMDREAVKAQWPDGRISSDWPESDHDERMLLESVYYNMRKASWQYKVHEFKSGHEIYERTYRDYSPLITGRYDVYPGETYGRGPLVHALPDIKSLNRARELILQNADLAITGVYTAADDGVINPDTIEIEPGVVIPVGWNGGVNGRSLDVLPRAGQFDIAQLEIKDLRNAIREAMHDNVLAPLDGTVRSAEEVRLRRAMLAEAIGPGPFSRVQNEVLFPSYRQAGELLARKGELPRLKMNGKVIKLDLLSLMSQTQETIDLDNINEAATRMNQIIPDLSKVAYNPPALAAYINEKKRVAHKVTLSEEDMAEAMQAVAGQINAGNIDPTKLLRNDPSAAGGQTQ